MSKINDQIYVCLASFTITFSQLQSLRPSWCNNIRQITHNPYWQESITILGSGRWLLKLYILYQLDMDSYLYATEVLTCTTYWVLRLIMDHFETRYIKLTLSMIHDNNMKLFHVLLQIVQYTYLETCILL